MPVLLCSLFFCAGASALVFETLWFHQAGLSLGNTVWASSVVLAAFMAGLALGNALAARLADRVANPLRTYARLEFAIAATGIALVYVLPETAAAVGSLLGPWLDSPMILASLRWVLAFITLLAPSTAMGSTLPVLARVLSAHQTNFGRTLGQLYGWNTLGAVAGAVAGPLWLVDSLGIRGSAWAAGGINIGIALVGLTLARRLDRPRASPCASPHPWPLPARWLLAAAGVSGALMLTLEVLWLRLCILFVLPDSFTFALMLATILAGLALGSLVASRLAAGEGHLPLAMMATGLCGLGSYVCLGLVSGHEFTTVSRHWSETLHLAVALMLPSAIASGICFTLLGRALVRHIEDPQRCSGLLTCANTAGATLGAALIGPGLLLGLGIEDGLVTTCGLYCIAAVCCARAVGIRRWWHLCVGTGLMLILVLAARGRLHEDYLLPGLERFRTHEGARSVAYREGIGETSILLETRVHQQHRYHRLVTNSYSMSSTAIESRRYMQAFVYLPLALHPGAKNALLISYGVGSTAYALTQTPELERIDIVDPSRDILELSRISLGVEAHPLDDPRVHTHFEGGRFFLQSTTRRFDLITGEPPPPKSAGIVNLFTREYFETMRDALNEGGIASYWLPTHSLEAKESLAIVRSFCGAFTDCSLWAGSGLDLILLGSRGERESVDADTFARQWRHPGSASQLRELGIEHPGQLGAMFLADHHRLAQWTHDVDALDDDHPGRLGRGAPSVAQVLPVYRSWLDVEAAREHFAQSPWIAQHWPKRWRKASLRAFDYQADIHALTTTGPSDFMTRLGRAHHLLQTSQLRTLVQWWLGTNAQSQRAAEAAADAGIDDPAVGYELAVAALAARKPEQALELGQDLLREGVRNPQVLGVTLLAHCNSSHPFTAIELAQAVGLDRAQGGPAQALWQFVTKNCQTRGRDKRGPRKPPNTPQDRLSGKESPAQSPQ